ncbi:MAG: Ig-like domain-containing protein [Planctomycetota bacterium]
MLDAARRTTRPTWLGVLALLAACGGGGGDDSAPSSAVFTALGAVQLLAHTPADGATQVAVAAEIELEFDAAMALDSFGDVDTQLAVEADGVAVPGAFRLVTSRRVHFRPTTPLAVETDYVFRLSPLTCDQDGRILDVECAFRFRTVDTSPPRFVDADVAAGATDVVRDRAFRLTFDERLDPAAATTATVSLRDVDGNPVAAAVAVDGADVVVDPLADLRGDRQHVLTVTTALRDVAGNPLLAAVQRSFRTAVDTTPPTVLTAWPPANSTGVSPLAHPRFQFTESMDLATVAPNSLRFRDEAGNPLAYTVTASGDLRSLRVIPTTPLAPGRNYVLTFTVGATAVRDVTGNALTSTLTRSFRTGTDAAAPQLVASVPAAGATRVPGDLVAELQFDEALDPAWVGDATVAIEAAGAAAATLTELGAGNVVRVTPLVPLPPGADCTLRVRGGPEGLRDVNGNTLGGDLTIAFRTSVDEGTPSALLLPPEGAVGLGCNTGASVTFDAVMDPATLVTGAVELTTDAGGAIPCDLEVAGSGRSVLLRPRQPRAATSFHRLRVRGGAAGVRRATGTWLPAPLETRFRTGAANDLLAPSVTCTLNGIAAARQQGLTMPPAGFTIDLEANDGAGHVDVARCEVLLDGPSAAPATATLLAPATLGNGFARMTVPLDTALAPGSWTLRLRVPDLCGNAATSAALAFDVVETTTTMLPFERTQVVWIRTDVDLDGNGRGDFDDDLLRLGFAVDGGHAGSQAFVRRALLDAILAETSRLYGRGPRGEPIGPESVAMRFTTRSPGQAMHMQISVGGFDPSGPPGRAYGSDSTGVLGRAVFDMRNGNPTERNLGGGQALGVFPAEMFLYQAKLHLQVFPSYATTFAQRFRPLCPPMGGTPVGSHPHDAAVLRDDFDPAAATSSERARRETALAAVADWSKVVAIVLAHEIGHSVGLVAPGAAPSGLFGDASLHNSFAGATEVMAANIGYETMVTMPYAFRDIDMAYLRQRVLVR